MVSWSHVLEQNIIVAGMCGRTGCSPHCEQERERERENERHKEREGGKDRHKGPSITFKGLHLVTYFLQLDSTFQTFYSLPK
jgi:hypothetical protein